MKVPDSTKASLASRLSRHAREHHPDLTAVKVRFRTDFAYVDGVAKDGTSLPLCRLRCTRRLSVVFSGGDDLISYERPAGTGRHPSRGLAPKGVALPRRLWIGWWSISVGMWDGTAISPSAFRHLYHYWAPAVAPSVLSRRTKP